MSQIPIKIYGTKKVKPLQVVFSSSQTYIIPSEYTSMDIFLVGGGGCGGVGTFSTSTNYSGGSGGGGGYTNTLNNITLTNQAVSASIGAGGVYSSSSSTRDGKTTTFTYNGSLTISANGGSSGTSASGSTGGKGGNGGSGGGAVIAAGQGLTDGSGNINGNGGSDGNNGENAYYENSSGYSVKGADGGTGQGTSTKAFGGTLYAGGGGTGETWNYNWYNAVPSTSGGAGGGGNGNNSNHNGTPNTGGGGAGGNANYIPCGDGGSGIVIIRLYINSDRPIDIDWTKNTINL